MLDEVSRSPTAERVARNEAAFREANERVKEIAGSFGHEEAALLPLLCECADVSCSEVVQLTAPEYEAVRREPTRFLNAHGHVQNAEGWAIVIEEHPRYSVVEKIGDAAAIAAQLDPRKEEPT